MSYSTFAKALKSTFDSVIHQMAVTNGYEYMDLDAAALDSSLVMSEAPALTWALLTFAEHPMDPLYHLEMEIGGKTSLDPAQRVSMDLVSLVFSEFHAGRDLLVYDFTGTVAPTVPLGIVNIISVTQLPQQYDQTAALRMVRVAGYVQRFV